MLANGLFEIADHMAKWLQANAPRGVATVKYESLSDPQTGNCLGDSPKTFYGGKVLKTDSLAPAYVPTLTPMHGALQHRIISRYSKRV